MNPLALLATLSRLAIFIPAPWGPIIAGFGKIIPLVQDGMIAFDAVRAADPQLIEHLKEITDVVFPGLDISTAAKAIFAPHQMTDDERFAAEQRWMNAQGSGG